MTRKSKAPHDRKRPDGAKAKKTARGEKSAAGAPKTGAAGEMNGKNEQTNSKRAIDGNAAQHSGDDRKSREEILAGDASGALCRALLCCRDEEECRAFINDLCTPQEIAALSERWVIARLLAATGMSYRDISAATGASTTTIGRVARFLQQEQHKGYQLVLARLTGADDGADARNPSRGRPRS